MNLRFALIAILLVCSGCVQTHINNDISCSSLSSCESHYEQSSENYKTRKFTRHCVPLQGVEDSSQYESFKKQKPNFKGENKAPTLRHDPDLGPL